MENVISAKVERSLARSTAIEAFTGIGAVVLAILALLNLLPVVFTSIATMAIGVSFLIQGIAISANYSALLSETTGSRAGVVDFTGGLTTEFIGGLGGITLGLLSLLGVASYTLLPVAALTLGGTLLFSSGETAHLSAISDDDNNDTHKIVNGAIRSSVGAQILVGLGAIALGIIALTTGIANTFLFSSIAILSIGGVEFSKGSALSAKMMRMLERK